MRRAQTGLCKRIQSCACAAAPRAVHAFCTPSDFGLLPRSFYFVGDKLIMHNKAYYKYVEEDAGAQAKSYEKYNTGAKGDKGSKGAKVCYQELGRDGGWDVRKCICTST